MSKYLDPLLRIMILLMFWIAIMRIRYIWKLSKIDNPESNIMFRNQDGDWSILFFVLLILNKSRFDRFKISTQPLLRYFYVIVVGLFVAYTVLQLTQFVLMTKDSLITQEVMIENANIEQYQVKKRLYAYKITINYRQKGKSKYLSLFTTRKNKEIIEKRCQEQHVNIV